MIHGQLDSVNFLMTVTPTAVDGVTQDTLDELNPSAVTHPRNGATLKNQVDEIKEQIYNIIPKLLSLASKRERLFPRLYRRR